MGSHLIGMSVLLVAFSPAVLAQQTALKQLPPQGIEISDAERAELTNRIEVVQNSLSDSVQEATDGNQWRADIEVLVRAVQLALDQDLFFKKSQLKDAEALLAEGQRRIEAAREGKRGLALLGYDAAKKDSPQTLVGGFVSRIDDSVQPFGIVIPPGVPIGEGPLRMDVWLHGRGDTKTEIPFLRERMTKVGHYAPVDTVVLHPFGRHCNAFKFAGETDVYEAMDHAKSLLQINPDKVSIRGFSMGGAGVWHLAVHDPTQWMAANPGAGFVDTLVYQGWNDSPPFELTPTAKKLLQWYDVLPWTANLAGTRTVAYSGEVDKQKQAADRVVERASRLGIDIPYVIGAKMGHKIDDTSKTIIDETISGWAEEQRERPIEEIDFLTYTLRYSKAEWLRITGMEQQWSPASVKATLERDEERVNMVTNGVTHLELDFSKSGWPGDPDEITIQLDGESFLVSDSGNIRGFQCELAKDAEGRWTQLIGSGQERRKRPGLQGPIDDAFCDRFVIVLPSRPARHGRVQRWIDRETAYLKSRWERLMRGEVRVVLDRDLTEDLIETSNLICFGDFSSNRFLYSISNALPVTWTREELLVGEQSFDPVKHVPVFIYPNPVNPDRYLVVNSGMTFRDFSNVSNSRQIAMLPDWAVLDVTSKENSIYAGEIQAQGFFNEQWELPKDVDSED